MDALGPRERLVTTRVRNRVRLERRDDHDSIRWSILLTAGDAAKLAAQLASCATAAQRDEIASAGGFLPALPLEGAP